MAAQDNAQLARRMYDLFNEGRLDSLSPFVDQEVVATVMPLRAVFTGRREFSNFARQLKSAFPDITVTVNHQVVGDGFVVNELTAKGTHTGRLKTPTGDIGPTGRKAEFPLIEVWEIEGGQLATLRQYYDLATIMLQIGAMPTRQAKPQPMRRRVA